LRPNSIVRTIVLALLTLPAITTTANAQAVEAPERVTQAPLVQGTIRTFDLSTSIFGGYDRNDVPLSAQQAPNVSLVPNSVTSWGSANLQYSIANGPRVFAFGGGGHASTNNNQINPGPVFGTHANVDFQTPVGQQLALSFTNSARRAPYYTTGVFGGLPPGVYSPGTNPINGIVDGYLWSLTSSTSLGYSMTRRTATSFTYTYLRSRHEGGITSEMSLVDHAANVTSTYQTSRTTGIQGTYGITKQRSQQVGLVYEGFTQSFALGFNLSQPLGPTRTLEISAGGGASQVGLGSDPYWQPSYYARFATDIRRTWIASANYSQMTTMLYSPLSAPDPYLTRSLMISVGGDVSRDLQLVMNAGASQGNVTASHSVTGSSGYYTGLNAGAQLTARLTSGWSAVIGANYFESQLSGAAKQFQVSSGNFERASLRGGLTWNLPLLGTRRVGRRRE
jgi:hypothetical protein